MMAGFILLSLLKITRLMLAAGLMMLIARWSWLMVCWQWAHALIPDPQPPTATVQYQLRYSLICKNTGYRILQICSTV